MSVLIKGIEMPKSCFACDFYSGNECYLYSYGIPARYNYNPDTKPEWCELVEVPTPHGRLIDADELLKHKTDHEMISTHLVWNAPTIIEEDL